MDNTQYNYIKYILKDNKIIGVNYVEKEKISNIRKLYSIVTNDEKTILYKIVKGKNRIVISQNDMGQIFSKYHDNMNHSNKSQFNKLLNDYYWDTKQMDIDYYLSVCKVCRDKYKLSDGKDKKKKRFDRLKSENLNKTSIGPKKRKFEEYPSESDSESISTSESQSETESDSDGDTTVVIKNKPKYSKLSFSVSTKKKTPSSPPKPIQNLLPKQPPKKKMELSKNIDEEPVITINKKRNNKKLL
ncbi:hypothetical protein ACTA71_008281 [Dictyostelium dimigraforme]